MGVRNTNIIRYQCNLVSSRVRKVLFLDLDRVVGSDLCRCVLDQLLAKRFVKLEQFSFTKRFEANSTNLGENSWELVLRQKLLDMSFVA